MTSARGAANLGRGLNDCWSRLGRIWGTASPSLNAAKSDAMRANRCRSRRNSRNILIRKRPAGSNCARPRIRVTLCVLTSWNPIRVGKKIQPRERREYEWGGRGANKSLGNYTMRSSQCCVLINIDKWSQKRREKKKPAIYGKESESSPFPAFIRIRRMIYFLYPTSWVKSNIVVRVVI